MTNRSKTAINLCLTILLGTLFSSSALAQSPGDPPPFAERYNETQLSLGVAIFSLVDAYGSGAGLTGLESEMFAVCDRYNQDVWDNTSPEATDANLEIVDFISHEEVGAVGSSLSDTSQNQIGSVLGRVQELRGINPSLASIGSPLLSGGAAGDDFSRFSYFVNANLGNGSKDRTRREQGFDFDAYGITGGVDYRVSDEFFAGVALSLGQSEVDIDRNLGSTDTDSVSITFYGSYYIDNWYVDAALGFSQYDYDNQRNLFVGTVPVITANQFIKSSTDGDALNLSLGGGYNSELRGWQATYSARLDMTDASIDGYTEDLSNSLALNIGKQDVESLQLVLGAQFTKSYGKKWGTLNPFFGLELHNEFDDDTRVVSAQYAYDRFGNTFSFTSDDADSNYFLLSVGSSFVLSHGRQAFVSFDKVVGLEDVDSNSLTAGIRFEL